jgi:lipid II:glycine glycyltransferase (peptidoglycan interpeptide bridge formation enzyme)
MTLHSNVSEIDPTQWNELVAKSPTASFFQTPECFDFYTSLTFLKAFVFAVSENGKLMGLVCGYIISEGNFIKRFFTRRAIVPGGILLDQDISREALQLLLGKLKKELQKESIYIEIRNYTDFSSFRKDFETNGFVYKAHLNFHVQTLDIDSALAQLNSTKRRDIKLSKKEGAEWLETKETEEVKDFYELLVQLYETKIKTPLFPFEFFEKLVQLPNGKLFIVKYQGKVIGGSVCIILQEQTIYEWFVCGLDGQIKNVFPSTVATWAGIEYAAINGFMRFDMMGAGKPGEGYGVREFKSKFGGEMVEHGRFLFICKPVLYNIGRYIVGKLKNSR